MTGSNWNGLGDGTHYLAATTERLVTDGSSLESIHAWIHDPNLMGDLLFMGDNKGTAAWTGNSTFGPRYIGAGNSGWQFGYNTGTNNYTASTNNRTTMTMTAPNIGPTGNSFFFCQINGVDFMWSQGIDWSRGGMNP
jgi:hypothetical protein